MHDSEPDMDDSKFYSSEYLAREFAIPAILLACAFALGAFTAVDAVTNADRMITSSAEIHRLEWTSLWAVLTFVIAVIYSWPGTGLISLICLITAARLPRYRRAAYTLLIVAIALLILYYLFRALYPRAEPLTYNGAFADMHVACAIAFYGGSAFLAGLHRKLAMQYIASAAAVSGTVLCTFWAIFFGYAWPSDVAGGALLGLAVLLALSRAAHAFRLYEP